jgi:DMSO/TMAO reductase YedYZ molybdopterin-dependent catalytic subunit
MNTRTSIRQGRTSGLVGKPLRLTWQECMAPPKTTVGADFQCVTRWSRFYNHWEGVRFRAISELTKPKPDARPGCLVPKLAMASACRKLFAPSES